MTLPPSPLLDLLFKLPPTCTDPTFGFHLATDTATNCAYISKIQPVASAENLFSSSRATHRKFIGAFITAVSDAPVFSVAKATRTL
jgi:hypothetical protein